MKGDRSGVALVVAVTLLLGLLFGAVTAERAAAATLPPGFQESVVFTGLTNPTAVRFSPDGRVFVAEKSGIIKVFDSLTDTTPSCTPTCARRCTAYNDRGLLGLALDPSFPTVQDIYVSYAHDAAIGGTAPVWGQPDADADGCPTPPGPNLDGCVISGRLSRLSSRRRLEHGRTTRRCWPTRHGRTGALASRRERRQRMRAATTALGSYVDTPTLGAAGALAGSANTSVGFNGTSRARPGAVQLGALNPASFTVEAWAYVTGGQGTYRAVVSSRDYAPGQRTRLHPLRGVRQHLAVLGRDGRCGVGTCVRAADRAQSRGRISSRTYDGTTAAPVCERRPRRRAPRPPMRRTRRARCASRPGATSALPTTCCPGAWTRSPSTAAALSAARVQAHYAAGNRDSGRVSCETVLIEDWCQQFPTGSVGGLEFGRDGALYMAGGAGGSYTFNDWGQEGNPLNPVRRSAGRRRARPSRRPTAEGGWLRSQDLRTTGDPVGLGGTLIRVDKNTGAGLADNPLVGNADRTRGASSRYGLRNPYRIAIRPGTRDVWIGDVGAGTAEEIDSRRRTPTDATVENFGWPCYEGPNRQGGFDAADLAICENLYAQSGAVTPPFFAYTHGVPISPTENCPDGLGLGHLGPRLRADDRWCVSRRPTPARCSSPTTRAIASGR